ncbi:hypothetical protein CAPTEDRAFT_202814 [Capitella teleta]|uniref:G-protein coupled receptors family 1 profile domain-containing protein n=1 Tax=Capitella teleta TaxID=283909 RepID=R7URQ0_CAPTE|nr:hypothetical protein CAPTEDRAFT_202814 [Capitella teleta]|eukprot:ELU09199.1 hypothetical protein CAPTEDRAFT_202814 [Capitella teleta]
MTYESTGMPDEMATGIDNATSSMSIVNAQPTKDISTWYPWALVVVYLVLGGALVFNLITAIAYVKSPLLSKGKPVHQLIFNMTITDFIACLVSQPFVLFQYTEAGVRHITGRKFECIGSFVGLIVGFDSTVTALLLITCERLFAIISPLQHMHRVTRKTCRVAILVTWTLVTAKSSVLFLWNKWTPFAPCIGLALMSDLYSSYVYNLALYLCMGLVAFFNVVLGCAVVVAKRKAGIMNASQTTTKSVRRKIKSSQGELKIVKIVFLAVGVLFITWIPNNTLANTVLFYVKKGQAPPYDLLVAYHMTRSMPLFGTVADPLIYFLQNSQCRSAVLRLLGRTEAQLGRQQSIYSLDSNTTESRGSVSTLKTVTDC